MVKGDCNRLAFVRCCYAARVRSALRVDENTCHLFPGVSGLDEYFMMHEVGDCILLMVTDAL